MTDCNTFENPEIVSPYLSTTELEKILSLQGEMLKRAVVRNDFAQLLDELCLLAQSFTPNAVAAIMLYDREREALFVENAPGLSEAAIEAFNGLRSGDGSCGNAVYHGEAMYVCDTQKDARWSRISNIATQFNIVSCFSFPILNTEGDAIGSFSISSFEPRTPDGFHRALLETCTSICGVILQRRADDELKHRLLEEQIKAERVEGIGILAGGIAHDFNNLLTTIMGNVELTAATLPDGSDKEGLQLAMKAIESASQLARRLRTVAKGGRPIRKPNDIGRIIRESAEFSLHGSNVSYEFNGLENLPSPLINVDGGQIGQLIQNLVLNARQSMPDGGVVRIECSATDQNDHATLTKGQYLRITVSDTGTGIAKGDAEHVFEPYFTTREQGSGLGLFLCYSITKSHSGIIFADSEPEVGSKFTVYLPRDDFSLPVDTPLPIDDSMLHANVLLMDDDRLVRRTLGRMLQQIGCTVWEAAEGNEAIECYKNQRAAGTPIDVTILDLTVPGGMGGVDAMKELRRIDPAARVVVSSGYSTHEACANYKAAGFDATMPKPYGIAELKAVIGKLVR